MAQLLDVRPLDYAMLTLEKLKVYRSFNGDDYAWRQSTKGSDPSGITDEDWLLIARLVLGFAYMRDGLLPPDVKETVERDLIASTPDEETRQELRSFA